MRAHSIIGAALSLLSFAFARPATAQFISLDRQADGAHLGLRLDLNKPSGDSEGWTQRTEIYGQVFFGAIGAYASLPLTAGLGEDVRDEQVFGNLEVGAVLDLDLFLAKLPLRAGLSLPTASTTAKGQAANARGIWGRLTDSVNILPDVLAFRLSAAPRIDLGIAYVGADVGLDFPIDTGGDRSDSLMTYVRANLAAGVGLPLVSLSVELVNVGNVGSGSLDSFDANWQHALTFGLRLSTPFIKPYAAYTLPLDEAVRGELHVFTLGAQIEL